jgi:type IV pilus assembly protein PilM
VQSPEVLTGEVAALAPPTSGHNVHAALILPDYCARTAVLDFDAFPANHEEQRALVRFRMKKTVPFDLESAIVSHYAQPADAGRIDVVVALIPQEIVWRYEAPFRAAGFQPGEVTTSALAALHMVEPAGITMLAKLGGRTLSVMVLRGPVLKLSRCVELADAASEEILSVLHPTVAFVEDELHARPERLLLCGFGRMMDDEAPFWRTELGVEVEPLRSRYGTPSWTNAGLLGYMESLAA